MFSHVDGFSEMHKYAVPCGSGSQQCSGRGWYRFSQLSGTHWWVDIDVEIASLVGSGSEVEVFGVADGFKSRKGHFISIQLPLQPQKGFRLQRSLNNPISTGGDEWCFVRPQPWHGEVVSVSPVKRILSGEQVTWILSIMTAMKNDWWHWQIFWANIP